MPSQSLSIKAHAKVNLGLRVTGRRPDGYHDIDTVFARIALHDTLRLEPRQEGIALEVKGADLPAGRHNLAYRAAQRYLEAAGLEGGVAIRLKKRIPIAAGLGGGSSDAAAVLCGLATLYPAGLDLLELAGGLGADVPFFVSGLPAASAQGIGDRLSKLELPELHLVLVNPGIEVSARDAYANLQGFGPKLDPDASLMYIKSALSNSKGDEPGYGNDLQRGVLELEPAIDGVLTALGDAGLRGVLMSGSGSTCFGLAQDAAHAREVADGLSSAHPGWWVLATRTL
ncbi:MAG: 4-(cytidine 5'-diphospho)-2-C-methyl-D-erythritol kinase [Deinococcota bacterium]|nr:4-(cytidine 5'-diphospho)-2-C-methyl-D-erythritol kinase [Deinococcota bacterium]